MRTTPGSAKKAKNSHAKRACFWLSLAGLAAFTQGLRKRGGGGALAPQILAKELTLSQPGGHIIPTTVLQVPPDFQTLRQTCYYTAGAVALLCCCSMVAV